MHGQVVSARLEMSPKRKPLAKAHAMFLNGLKEVGGNESKVNSVYGKIQISFFVGGNESFAGTAGDHPHDFYVAKGSLLRKYS